MSELDCEKTIARNIPSFDCRVGVIIKNLKELFNYVKSMTSRADNKQLTDEDKFIEYFGPIEKMCRLCIPCFTECFERWHGYFGGEVRILNSYVSRNKVPAGPAHMEVDTANVGAGEKQQQQ